MAVPGRPILGVIERTFVQRQAPAPDAAVELFRQLLQGVETLDLRIARHSASALEVARFLESHDAVARVHHPGLVSSPWHALARDYLPRGASSVFAFDLPGAGDAEADFALVEAFVARLRLVKLVASIGDARSLVAHPSSMTHSHLSAAQLADAGITPTTVRLSIGLEDPADIVADLAQALDAVPVLWAQGVRAPVSKPGLVTVLAADERASTARSSQ